LNGADAEPLDVERFPKLLRQAHDAEIIDLSKQDDGVYAVKLREETPPPASLAPAASTVPTAPTAPEPVGAADLDEANDPPMPASSAPPPLRPATPTPSRGGVPSRSARFRRGSRGPRVTPPEIPKIGVVEVDPNFKPRIELVPAKRPDSDIVGAASGPAPGRDFGDESGRADRGSRGGRGRRGGGRGQGQASGRD